MATAAVDRLGDRDIPTPADLRLPAAKQAIRGDIVAKSNCARTGVLTQMKHLENRELWLPMDRVHPRLDQPRQHKPERKSKGAEQMVSIQVIPFSSNGETHFLIVDGEERYQKAKEKGVRAIQSKVIWDPSLDSLYDKAVILNEARVGLNPMDAAHAFRRTIKGIMNQGSRKTEGDAIEILAGRIEQGVSYVRDRLKLLDLIPDLQEMVAQQRLRLSNALDILTPVHRPEENQRALFEKLNQLAPVDNIKPRVFAMVLATYKRPNVDRLTVEGAADGAVGTAVAAPALTASAGREKSATAGAHSAGRPVSELPTRRKVSPERRVDIGISAIERAGELAGDLLSEKRGHGKEAAGMAAALQKRREKLEAALKKALPALKELDAISRGGK